MNLHRTALILGLGILFALAACEPAVAKLEPQPVTFPDATEVEIAHEAERIEDAMIVQGEAKVIGRFARDLGIVPDSLVMEKVVLDAPWVDVLVAHLIHANAPEASVRNMIEMRRSHRSWAEIATTYGFAPARVVRAVRAEARVAVGIIHVDGRAAAIRRTRDPHGARAGFEATHAGRRGD